MSEYGKFLAILALTVIVIVLITIGVQFLFVSTSKQIIENSKSYIDSRNEKASMLILKYEGATESQQKFIKNEICGIYDELQNDSSKSLVKFAVQYCD